jgi:hypothetical protein
MKMIDIDINSRRTPCMVIMSQISTLEPREQSEQFFRNPTMTLCTHFSLPKIRCATPQSKERHSVFGESPDRDLVELESNILNEFQ